MPVIIGCTKENNCKRLAFLRAKMIEEARAAEKDKGGETGTSSENPGKKSPDNEFDRESRVAEQQNSESAEKEAEVSSENSRSS
ncbi:hypothetical protein K0M31_002200 [Melipona bicolor]|uniref:Uncharacterized protein n=1 Tax=Melipona bicolor TaxID=60889 RepID=A0AA40KYB2_9HYME|nr:hypothetical protein K0M31_002200 [Melipona bicolor]